MVRTIKEEELDIFRALPVVDVKTSRVIGGIVGRVWNLTSLYHKVKRGEEVKIGRFKVKLMGRFYKDVLYNGDIYIIEDTKASWEEKKYLAIWTVRSTDVRSLKWQHRW